MVQQGRIIPWNIWSSDRIRIRISGNDHTLPGSYSVHSGILKPQPASSPAPPGTQMYPSAPDENTYASGYAAVGVINPPLSGGYSASAPPRQQQQYYPPPAPHEPEDIN